jgi:S1-C subfamily serine protease
MRLINMNVEKLDSGLKAESEYLTNCLNESLLKLHFIDTNDKLFKIRESKVLVKAVIKKVRIHEVTFAKTHRRGVLEGMMGYLNSYSRMLELETSIDWEIMNDFKETIMILHTEQRSDPFQFDVSLDRNSKLQSKRSKKDAVNIAFADNLEYSFLQLRKQLEDHALLTQSKRVDTLIALDINVGTLNPATKLNDIVKSSVSILVDQGHGSGVIISSDGYIVTNYHVIANSKKIEVIFNDGTKDEATVVRRNYDGDLALLKVKTKGLMALPLGTEKDIVIGDEVCAIGTPKTIELGQSISKGIVSNVRKMNNFSYIQTDAKVSPGNSGGALIYNNGLVLGIITSKLIGKGTEGISFAIVAPEILKLLKLHLIQ